MSSGNSRRLGCASAQRESPERGQEQEQRQGRPQPLDVGVLSAILALVAGFVDAACFRGLSQVFTAHVTGNFAALAVAIVGPSSGVVLRVVVIAAFGVGTIIALLATRRIAAFNAIVRRALLVELAMLAAVLAVHFAFGGQPSEKPWVAMFAAAAMGAQSALSKLPQALASPTTVMTSNYTQWAISLVDVLAPLDVESSRAARAYLARMSLLLLAFVPGAFAGAYGEARFGFWALGAPLFVVACAVATIAIAERRINRASRCR
jgi:uncharacterized membrane protein YoaK (UPF0700 family)